MTQIRTIVLTGGPCAGKTTALVRVIEHFNNLGFKVSFWSYAYNDYSEEQMPVPEALQKALDSVHPGAIYLLHAKSDTNTAMLADFIDGVRAKGFGFGVYDLTAR